jgi:hypothetical protein
MVYYPRSIEIARSTYCVVFDLLKPAAEVIILTH